MEGYLWRRIVAWLPASEECRGRQRFDDRTILRVVLWAVLHDRPMNWACRTENWLDEFRPPRLPSPSTLSRRWRQPQLREAVRDLHARSVAAVGPATRDGILDGFPLEVGGGSQDRDARPGRAVGHLAKGHKLFAIVNAHRAITTFTIGALADAETKQALLLIPQAPATMQRLRGDGLYDSLALHRCCAAHRRRLYTPLREGRVGRRQQPERLRLWRLWQTPVGQKFLHGRDAIERSFGLFGNFACGFKGLPPWARRHHRVTRWVSGKILVYHAYLACYHPVPSTTPSTA
jgi:hypothetical protein